MKYDIEYWKNTEYMNYGPTAFAKFCLPYIQGSVLDVCCGNGRDSDYFHSKGIETIAFDIKDRDKPYEYFKFDLRDLKSWDFGMLINYDNIYLRYVLHAFPEYIEDYILTECYHNLDVDGRIFIQARSDKDIEDGNHYRRLINIDNLTTKLINLGFNIIHNEERNGLYTDYDDPVLIRIIAERQYNIRYTSDMTWDEFHNTIALDISSAKHMLLSVNSILHDIPFFLAFGTLLGAYRDNKFIESARDVDVAVLVDYRDKIDELIKKRYFIMYGIELIREDDTIRTFRYNNDYIDIYFFEKRGNEYWCGRSYSVKDYMIEEPSTMKFLDKEFRIFGNVELYLEHQYGKDWQTPKL